MPKRPLQTSETAQDGGVSPDVLEQLRSDLAYRRVAAGIACLEKQSGVIEKLRPEQPRAASFADYLAQWVDIGYGRTPLVQEVLQRFTKTAQRDLSFSEYVHLRMAQGMAAMAEEEADEAIRHLDFVLSSADELQQTETLAIANFWKGRCLRKKGEYDEAMTYTLRGQQLALQLGYPKMAAVMRVLESWLLFQKGRSKEALGILQQAEEALRDTDDHLTLGNIHSSYGRIARRECRYEQAIEHFTKAIAEYRKRDRQHRNLGRSLINIAIVKRYICLQMSETIDAAAERRREAVAKGSERRTRSRSAQMRDRLLQLRQEAFAELEEAKNIYTLYPNHHGLGSVFLNSGYLHLDNGDFEQAAEAAQQSFQVAQEKSDLILMARARLLQCMVDNARLEDEVGEGPTPGSHARRALDFAREAVDLARRTQNRRVLATALIWQGLTESNSFVNDFEAAQHSYDQATAALKGESPGNLWDDLKTLRARLFRTGSVDPQLRAWTQGLVGAKSFQQVVEDFADLVIPKVWERENRKVSRVAKRLAMSPKKVRRILARAVRRTGRKT